MWACCMKPVMRDAWNGEAGKLEKRAQYQPPPEDAVMRQRLAAFTPSSNGSNSILRVLGVENASAGNQQLLRGSKVMREEMEIFPWHQLYQHSLCEVLRSAPFLMGVCTNLCIMVHRVML